MSRILQTSYSGELAAAGEISQAAKARQVATQAEDGTTASVPVEGASPVKGTSGAERTKPDLPAQYEMRGNNPALVAELEKLVKELFPDMKVEFKIHEGTGQVITKMTNSDKNVVVREYPPEKILDMIHNMASKLGMVVDKRV